MKKLSQAYAYEECSFKPKKYDMYHSLGHLLQKIKDRDLTTISISNQSFLTGLIDDQNFEVIISALKANNSITEISLEGICIGRERIENVASILKNSSTLTYLHLKHNNIGNIETEIVASALKSNNALTWLDLSNNNIGKKGALSIASALEINSTLTRFSLCYNDISRSLSNNGINNENEEVVAIIIEALETNKSITRIDLENNFLKNQAAIKIGKILASNNVIEIINLYNNRIECLGAKAIFKGLKFNNSLQVLDLTNNCIKDQGAFHLAQALEINKIIKLLALRSNYIESKGAFHLVQALKTNRSLTEIDLSYNSVKEQGVIELAEILRVNNIITKIMLNGINIDSQALPINILGDPDALKKHMELVYKKEQDIDQGVIALSQALRFNNNVLAIELQDNKIENTEALEILNFYLQRNINNLKIITNFIKGNFLDSSDNKDNHLKYNQIHFYKLYQRTNKDLLKLNLLESSFNPGSKEIAKILNIDYQVDIFIATNSLFIKGVCKHLKKANEKIQETSIHNAPQEVLLHILSFVGSAIFTDINDNLYYIEDKEMDHHINQNRELLGEEVNSAFCVLS